MLAQAFSSDPRFVDGADDDDHDENGFDDDQDDDCGEGRKASEAVVDDEGAVPNISLPLTGSFLIHSFFLGESSQALSNFRAWNTHLWALVAFQGPSLLSLSNSRPLNVFGLFYLVSM